MLIIIKLSQPSNAKDSISVTPNGMVTLSSFLLLLNIEFPTDVTPAGNVKLTKPELPNALVPITCTPSGKLISVKPVQPKNALAAISVILSGISILGKLMQPLNVELLRTDKLPGKITLTNSAQFINIFDPVDVMLSGRTMLVKLVFWNALCSMNVTEFGIKTPVIV